MCTGAKAAELRRSRGCWAESPGLPRPLPIASARRHFFDLFPPSFFPPSHFAPELLLLTRAAALVTHDILMSVTLCLLLAGASYKLTTRLQRSSRLLHALFSHLISKEVHFGSFGVVSVSASHCVPYFGKFCCPSCSWITFTSRMLILRNPFSPQKNLVMKIPKLQTQIPQICFPALIRCFF